MIGRLSCDVGGATMRLCEHLHVQRQGCQFKLLSREGPMGLFSRSGTARHRDQDSPRHTRRRKGVASPWAFVRSTVQKRAYAGATARAACLHRGQSLIFTLTIPWRHMSTENLMLERSRDACVTPNPPLSMVMYYGMLQLQLQLLLGEKSDCLIAPCSMLGHCSGYLFHCGFPLPCLR